MWEFLNIFFFVFHSLWMLFNCVGWYWRRTRRWHLLTVTLTAMSWLLLGFWYEPGYCICTDWHCRVREKLGYPNPDTYTQLLIQTVTGVEASRLLADTLTVGIFAIVVILTIIFNTRDYLRWRRKKVAAGGNAGV
jgi:hypothetical protein